MLSVLIDPSDIKVGLLSSEKEECLAELLEVIRHRHPEIDREEALQSLINREDKTSTAILPFIAVPHAVCKSLDKTAISIGISKSGIDFESENSENPIVNIIFEILFNKDDIETMVKILRDILQISSHPDFFSQILNANSPNEVYNIIEYLES